MENGESERIDLSVRFVGFVLGLLAFVLFLLCNPVTWIVFGIGRMTK